MIDLSLITTVSDCDIALARANQERAAVESRKFSLTRQLTEPVTPNQQPVTMASLQADLASVTEEIADARDVGYKYTLELQKNLLEKKILQFTQNGVPDPATVQNLFKQIDKNVATAELDELLEVIDALTTLRPTLPVGN